MSVFGGTMLGYYYTTLFIGNPPQRQTLIVDTGSPITTFPCKACGNDCGKSHFNPYFLPESSFTSGTTKCGTKYDNFECSKCVDDQCAFDISYLEGSALHGKFIIDDIRFGLEVEQLYANHSTLETKEQVKLADDYKIFGLIGCTTKETNLFYTQEADGILGVGAITNAINNPKNLVDYTRDEDDWAFSLCFADKGGYMTLGGYNNSYHDQKDHIHWVQKAMPYTYVIKISEIKVGDKIVKHEGNYVDALLDSGTTLFYGPTPAVSAIEEELHAYCMENGNKCGGHARKKNCYEYDPKTHKTLAEFFASFPPLNFNLSGEVYIWEADAYFFQQTSTEYCLSLQKQNVAKNFVFGGVFMKNHDILFDKKNDRIGFIKANCSAFLDLSVQYYSEFTPIDFVSLNNSNMTVPPVKKTVTFTRAEIHDFLWIIIAGVVMVVILIVSIIVYFKKGKLRRNEEIKHDIPLAHVMSRSGNSPFQIIYSPEHRLGSQEEMERIVIREESDHAQMNNREFGRM
jgi:hypothetical protein